MKFSDFYLDSAAKGIKYIKMRDREKTMDFNFMLIYRRRF